MSEAPSESKACAISPDNQAMPSDHPTASVYALPARGSQLAVAVNSSHQHALVAELLRRHGGKERSSKARPKPRPQKQEPKPQLKSKGPSPRNPGPSKASKERGLEGPTLEANVARKEGPFGVSQNESGPVQGPSFQAWQMEEINPMLLEKARAGHGQ